MLHRNKKQFFAFWSITLLLCTIFFSMSKLGKAASNESLYHQTTLTPLSGYPWGYPAPVEVTPQYSSGNHRIALPLINGTPDNYSLSYYVQDTDTMYSLGCDTGKRVASFPYPEKNGFVILDFGAPAYELNPSSGYYEYGTSLISYDTPFVPHIEMYSAVIDFMNGYTDCASPIAYTHLDLAIGINNANNSVMNDNTKMLGHSTMFGTLVRNLDNYSTVYLDDLIRVSIAMDVEHDPRYYADPGPTLEWINNASYKSDKPFYNFGNADCSMNFPAGNEFNVQPGICGPSEVPIELLKWTQEHISIVSSLGGWGFPMPEIYTRDGSNAKQWYRIGIYSSMKDRPLVFRGALTQWNACRQVGCTTGIDDNEPNIGYLQMSKYVATLRATDSRVGNEMQWRSDIMYQPTLTP